MGKGLKFICFLLVVSIMSYLGAFAAAEGELVVIKSDPKIVVYGEECDIETYNINGNNYVKIRDITDALGLYTEWDAKRATVIISDSPIEIPEDTLSIVADKYIIIDAGHGGAEPGAGNRINGIKEKDINLKVAKYLFEMLEEDGYRVELTRSEDKTLPLKKRMEMIEKNKPDVFVSVHHNASDTESYRGAVVLCQTNVKTKEESTKLAKYIGSEFEKIGQTYYGEHYRKGDRGEYYGVLRSASEVEAAAVITEFAYIDNVDDVKLLDSDEDLYNEAAAIYRAIINYLEDSQN